MSRKVNFVEGEYYHIYNRGVDKKKIFNNNQDYFRFITLLYLANSKNSLRLDNLKKNKLKFQEILTIDRKETLVKVESWCLMGNHFHLVLQEKTKGGISKFMLKLMTGYTMYFNKKNDHQGPIFSGVFKSKHILDDLYLKQVVDYVHFNPLEFLDNKLWKELGGEEASFFDKENSKIINTLKKYFFSSFIDIQNLEDRVVKNILT